VNCSQLLVANPAPLAGRWRVLAVGLVVMGGFAVSGGEDLEEVRLSFFKERVEPVVMEYCYDCHGDGMRRGQVAFDGFGTDQELLAEKGLWWAVLKNTRAGLMPPAGKRQPSAEERELLAGWIKREVFGIDPEDADPGRVTVRRLNRVEYRNTIRDLTGHDFNVDEELPPDDTGYGFDTIGDVLTMSPLLLEKYMAAAAAIVSAAVPRVAEVVAERTIAGAAFRRSGGRGNADRMSFYEPVVVSESFRAAQAGSYRLELGLQVLGQFDFDPGRCRVVFKAGEHELLSEELGWQNGKRFDYDYDLALKAGDVPLTLTLEPLVPADERKNSLDLRLRSVRVLGPLEPEHAVRPRNFERFFWKTPPAANPERREYAREVLARFASRAYRRPVAASAVERLVEIAESVYAEPGKGFEDGIAQAMIPVLASPRFLFRIEVPEPEPEPARHPRIDEHSLASRLSYFLWSTMPDEELLGLADRGELRRQFRAQLKRMLDDRRSQALIENFVGQWLQVRDLEGININERAVLARDTGREREDDRRRARLRELNGIPEDRRTPGQVAELRELLEQRRRRGENQPTVELDGELRRAMRDETLMSFAHVLRENRDVAELLDSDYTFLNERLARHYGVEGVSGREMRLVKLPPGSPRGGVLTHGSVLIVTSNPTRTSPVKRGLFVLDNLLGTPPPPPPPDVPELEEAERTFQGRQPTLREALELHRSNPLCHSCHNRMDPLGLALENFNALGMWRDAERGQPIESSGRLIRGQEFQDVREVKRLLATEHRLDFYRCLAEKLLTYALGRGLQYYDAEAVDRIVQRLMIEEGRFEALLVGIVESAPFQRQRNLHATASAQTASAAAWSTPGMVQP
jgi:hypothetical protein